MIAKDFQVYGKKKVSEGSFIAFFEKFPLQNIIYSLLIATDIYLMMSPFKELTNVKMAENL